MTNYPKTKIKKIVVQEFENEVLIYDLAINKAFCLNPTSAMVWSLCDGTKTVSEISEFLSRKLNEPATEDLIWLALDQFKRDGLLEDERFEINFKGLSRRQVIKKIGFASMVTLPLVASVIAPSALMASSHPLLPVLAACTSSAQCQSNQCVTCSQGTCNGMTVCCTGGGSFGPGLLLGSCTDPGTCNNLPVSCCSGMATLTVNGCSGFPTNGICRCA